MRGRMVVRVGTVRVVTATEAAMVTKAVMVTKAAAMVIVTKAEMVPVVLI